MVLETDDTLLNGQYRILGQIGRGGFGFFYHARDVELGDEVAIKELIPGLVGDDATLKYFLAEATIHLTHERIVRTFHVFPKRGNYYIVMEYMAGGSLEDIFRKRASLPVNEALRTAVQVCDGLAYAHGRRVVRAVLRSDNLKMLPHCSGGDEIQT